jgi:hypothetical protein
LGAAERSVWRHASFPDRLSYGGSLRRLLSGIKMVKGHGSDRLRP